MNPQGSSLVDTAYFDSAIEQLGAVQTPDELANILAIIQPSIAAQEYAAVSQLAALTPALELLTLNPADLPGLVSFISKFVTYVLTPQLKPAITYATQATALAAKAAALSAAASAAATRVGATSSVVPDTRITENGMIRLTEAGNIKIGEQ